MPQTDQSVPMNSRGPLVIQDETPETHADMNRNHNHAHPDDSIYSIANAFQHRPDDWGLASLRISPGSHSRRSRHDNQEPEPRPRHTARPSPALRSDLLPTLSTGFTDFSIDERRRARERRRNRPPALGTREDVENPDYQSPVAAMFVRSWERYRTAEEARRQADLADATRAPVFPSSILQMERYESWQNVRTGTPQRAGSPHPNMYSSERSDAMNVPERRRAHLRTEATSVPGDIDGTSEQNNRPAVMTPPVYPYAAEWQSSPFHTDLYARALHAMSLRDGHSPTPPPTFDTQERPPPRDSEEMVLDVACKICREQKIDTVLIPCMHACMCTWCADIQVPIKSNNLHVPQSIDAQCPICRKRVRERRKLYLG